MSNFTKDCNNFNGISIKAVYGNIVVGVISSLKCSVSRKVAPIYKDNADPRDFVRGKRGVSGSLKFIQFDCEPFLEQIRCLHFSNETDDLRPKYQEAIPWHEDQIPPFDIVLAAANEYGSVVTMKILGVELGLSVDDLVSEHSYTYIAKGILPWTTYTYGQIETEDKHEGMVYNEYTKLWTWL